MESIDLNIINYDLKDLLNLFKLKYNFDKTDLKKAKEMALRTHPDKSKLKKEIFIFFLEAYKRLVEIYKFRIKRNRNMHDAEYSTEMGDITTVGDKLLLKKLHGKSVKDFNIWFNDKFEKTKMGDVENDMGYGDWFGGEIEDSGEVTSLNDFGKYFNKQKNRQRAIVKHNGVSELSINDNGYNLNRDGNGQSQYSSHIFSKLQYEDLKKAHSETVVPVTMEDFENREKYRNVDELNRIRKNQDISAISKDESKTILHDRKLKEDELAAITAFNLLKQTEEAEKSNKEWWKYLKQLDN